MQNHDFLWFVDQSIVCLAQDVPEAYRAVLESARGLIIDLRSETSHGSIWISAKCIEVFGPGSRSNVQIRFDEQVVVDLLDGETSMQDVLNSGRLHLQGASEHLEQLISGLKYYIRGAVRSPAMQDLLEDYRKYLKY